jgi:D-alanyl-D-alanine carboxypeptidase
VVRKLSHVVATVKALGIPGGVIGVTGGAAGHFERAFGQASPGQKMSLTDHFRVASVTKTFTATVILELVDRHKLRLDQSIYKWEPRVPNARRITIRMLLNMTSGIWDEGGPGSLLSAWVQRNCRKTRSLPQCSRYWKPQQLVNLAIKQGPEFPPGVYNYTDTGYVILGIIAQKVTHRPMAWLFQHMIFGPLRMRHTSFPTRSLKIPKPAAEGNLPVFANKVITRYAHGSLASPSLLFSAGGIISTLGDLQIWARALALGSLLKTSTQRERLQLVSTGDAYAPLKGTGVTLGIGFGYGLGLIDMGGLIGHNGAYSVPGFTTELWYLPQRRASVIVLLNSITTCSVGFLSNVTAASLAELAFANSLQRLPLPPSFSPAICPAVAG